VSLLRRVAVNAIALSVGRALLTVTGVLSVAIATRYIGVELYGSLTTAVAFAGALGPLTDIGVAAIAARELAKRPPERDRLVGNVLALSFALSVAVAFVGIGIAQIVYSGEANEETRRAILLMLLLALPTTAPAVAATAYFIGQQQAWVFVLASVCGSLVTLSLLAASVTLDWGFNGVVVAYAGTAVAYGGALMVMSIGRFRLRPRFERRLAKQLLVWALPLGAASFLNSLYLRVDVIVLSLLSSKGQVALFGLSFRVVEALMALPFIVTITLMPEFARLAENQRAKLDQLVQRALRLMQIVVLPAVACVFVFAEQVVEVAGGPGFSGAADVLRILLIGVGIAFPGALLSQALIALNLQRMLLLVATVALVVNASLASALALELGAVGAATGFAVAEVCGVATLALIYGRTGQVPTPDRRPALLLAAGAMAAAATVKLPLQAASAGPILTFAIGSTAMLSAYVGSLYALRVMPDEIHRGLLAPAISWLRRGR
jgi:O-antigen/teichoic acid export membrane protein